MSFFVLTYSVEKDSFTPFVDSDGHMLVFSTVLEAERATGPDVNVYDLSKFQVPVPLVAPGTTVLRDGQWVKYK